MSQFGDYEPEDAWDADDPTSEQVINLFRRMDLLDGGGDRDALVWRLMELEARIDRWKADRTEHGQLVADQRSLLRAEQILDDMAFIRAREEL